MKAKRLLKIAYISAALMMMSVLWAVYELFTPDYNYWAIGVFTFLFFITGWVGVEHAMAAKSDPKGFVDSFNLKGLAVFVLVGLSFTCNGQNRFDKDFQEANSVFNDSITPPWNINADSLNHACVVGRITHDSCIVIGIGLNPCYSRHLLIEADGIIVDKKMTKKEFYLISSALKATFTLQNKNK